MFIFQYLVNFTESVAPRVSMSMLLLEVVHEECSPGEVSRARLDMYFSEIFGRIGWFFENLEEILLSVLVIVVAVLVFVLRSQILKVPRKPREGTERRKQASRRKDVKRDQSVTDCTLL